MDDKARFYDPTLGRFVQPDSIIPSFANPQSLNRYSYVEDNPIALSDPSGHAGGCKDSDSGYICKIKQKKLKELDPPTPPTGWGSPFMTPQTSEYYGDIRGFQTPATSNYPVSVQGGGGTGYGNALEMLASVNYRLSPQRPLTLFDSILPSWGELRIGWLPSLSVNNGSQITLTPSGVIQGPPARPYAPRFTFAADAPSVGYISSPLFGERVSAMGMSVNLPQMAQISASLNVTLQTPQLSYNSRIDVSYTARPDVAAVVLGAGTAGVALHYGGAYLAGAYAACRGLAPQVCR